MAKAAPWLAPAVWTGGLIPGVLLAIDFARDDLGANPVSAALNQLGLLSLISLTATLACTPLQLVFGWTWPARIRRALGLLTFTYVTLHLTTYVTLDLGFAFGTLADDLAKRPFIAVGFSAWLLLIPLALTSTNAAVRRLGFVRWKRLHRLVYVIAALGALHFIWRAKKDVREPLIYAAVLALLMAVRLVAALKKRRRAAMAG